MNDDVIILKSSDSECFLTALDAALHNVCTQLSNAPVIASYGESERGISLMMDLVGKGSKALCFGVSERLCELVQGGSVEMVAYRSNNKTARLELSFV